MALLPQNLRNGLILVSGASLPTLGGNHKMEDVEIAVTPSTLHAFFAAALDDLRFKGQLKLGIRLEQRHHRPLRVPHARQRFRACRYGIEGDWEGRQDEDRVRRVVVSSTGRPGRAASKPNVM